MSSKRMELVVPADMEYALAVGLAIDGLGMKAGLDLELLADLRTLCAECIDTLSGQETPPEKVRICAELTEDRLHLTFSGVRQESEPIREAHKSMEITQGILETLMPDVTIDTDDGGIHRIRCSMPV